MATVFENIRLDIDLLRQFLVQKAFTAKLLEFARNEGTFSIMRELDRFTGKEFCDAAAKMHAYKIDDAARKRMLFTLLDFFDECGYVLQEEPNIYRYSMAVKPAPKLSYHETEIVKRAFGDQSAFFDKCIDYAGVFLRGGNHLYAFESGMEEIWDKLLGSFEFSIVRDILLKAMAINGSAHGKILDLCYGTGHGLEAICRHFPDAEITAIDFTDVMKPLAMSRVGNALAEVQWVDANTWCGFGDKLPFEDMAFDKVFFSCGDPYIPDHLRKDVYKDIFRILKPGGILGMVAWGYPDKAKRHIRNEWRRKGIYIHDFAEGVCKGWYGFRDIDSTINMAREIGFVEDNAFSSNFYMLDTAVWMFKKP